MIADKHYVALSRNLSDVVATATRLVTQPGEAEMVGRQVRRMIRKVPLMDPFDLALKQDLRPHMSNASNPKLSIIPKPWTLNPGQKLRPRMSSASDLKTDPCSLQGKEFARECLRMSDVYHYMREMLSAYSSALSYDVAPGQHSLPVRSHNDIDRLF
jgi:hypothetical protein